MAAAAGGLATVLEDYDAGWGHRLPVATALVTHDTATAHRCHGAPLILARLRMRHMSIIAKL